MKPEGEIRSAKGVQHIGNMLGIGECGYFWEASKRVASLIWTRDEGGTHDHASFRPLGKTKLTDEKREKIKAIFFTAEEMASVETEIVLDGAVHFYLEHKHETDVSD